MGVIIDEILVVFGAGWALSKVMIVSEVEIAGKRTELITLELLNGTASGGDGNIIGPQDLGGHFDKRDVLLFVERISAGEVDSKWLIDGKDRGEDAKFGGKVAAGALVGVSGAVRTVVRAFVGEIPDDTDFFKHN